MDYYNNCELNKAVDLVKVIKAHGFQSYIVGGAVRNYCLNIPINDIDINTSALPEEIEMMFERTIPVGKEHGTIIVIFQDTPFEVTTFRTDGTYSDARRPDQVTFVTNLEEDVKRRDFTVNALAMNEELEVIDYVSGKKDIEQRLIRAVGNPYLRFEEDALRIIRAARFQSVLDFEIEQQTFEAMKQSAENISNIAVERVVNEMQKLILGMSPSKGLRTLIETHVINWIPFFKHVEQMILPKQSSDWDNYLGYLIYLDDNLVNYLMDLKLSNQSKHRIKSAANIFHCLLNDWSNEDLKLLIFEHGKCNVESALDFLTSQDININGARDILSEALPISSRKELTINGNDLMLYLNRDGGTWLKEELRNITEAVVLGHIANERNEILKWVDKHVKI